MKKTLKQINKFLENNWQKWTILVILGIVIYVLIIFYSLVYKPVYMPEVVTSEKLEIKTQTYEDIMSFHEQKQENIDQIVNKEYLDIFK